MDQYVWEYYQCKQRTVILQKKKENNLIVNGVYQHYKGKTYKIIDFVWASESNELERWVVYQGMYKDEKLGINPLFARSVEKFSEKVIIDGIEKPRFAYIESANTPR